jgi:hypothetical protein
MTSPFIDSMRYNANGLRPDLYFILEEFESVFLKLVDEGEAIISSNYDLERCKNYLLNDSFIDYYYSILDHYFDKNPTEIIRDHVLLAMIRIKKVSNFCRAGILVQHSSLDIGKFENLYRNSRDFFTAIAPQAYKAELKGVDLKTPIYNNQTILTSMREYERKLYCFTPYECKSKH